MYKIRGLPKTATIRSKIYFRLLIENQKVQNKECLMDWLMREILSVHLDWNYVLAQMIRQGFRIEAVVEECINDLKNPEKLKEIVKWIDFCRKKDVDWSGVAPIQNGMPIETYITKKLLLCRDLNQFYNLLCKDSVFYKNIQEKSDCMDAMTVGQTGNSLGRIDI